jgi:hypothetical protein
LTGPAGATGATGPQGPIGLTGPAGSSSNLIFGAHNISYNSELNLTQNGIQIVSQSGSSSWGGGGVAFTVPSGKIWKLLGFSSGSCYSGTFSYGENWLDEGQTLSFEGNCGSSSPAPFNFTAVEYTKSDFDFNVVSQQGVSSWGGGGVGFTVPAGKIWKILGYYAGSCTFGINTTGEAWLDEGQTLSFEGNCGSLSPAPFRFIAFEYTK